MARAANPDPRRTMSVRLPDSLRDGIDLAAERRGIPRNDFLVNLLERVMAGEAQKLGCEHLASMRVVKDWGAMCGTCGSRVP